MEFIFQFEDFFYRCGSNLMIFNLKCAFYEVDVAIFSFKDIHVLFLQQETSAETKKSEFREALSLPSLPPAISPLPDTPENVRQQMAGKGPQVPMSPKVKAAMEQLNKLKSGKTTKKVKLNTMNF